MPVQSRENAQRQKAGPLQDPEVIRELGTLVQLYPGAGAWVWELPSNTVHWSREVYRIFDAPDFDNTLEFFQNMILPEDLEANLGVTARALATREMFHANFRAKTPKGEIRHVSNVGRALYDDTGKPTMVVGLVTDSEPNRPLAENQDSSALVPGDDFEPLIRSVSELRDHLLLVKANPESRALAETDFKVLSYLLERICSRQEAEVLAARLLSTLNGMADVLSAGRARLKTVEGIREEHLQILEIAQLSMEIVLHPKPEPLRFNKQENLMRYLRATHAYQNKEHLRVIFFDRAHHVIANDLMQEGTVDHTPVYTREIIKRALELSASSLVIVHNHPSGDPTPSPSDIKLTRDIANVAMPLGITVKDHIILGRYGHVSLASMGAF